MILKNLMEMCCELSNTLVVTEGIESEEQAALLEEFSCDHGQSYYFYRPMTLEGFLELLGPADLVSVLHTRTFYSQEKAK